MRRFRVIRSTQGNTVLFTGVINGDILREETLTRVYTWYPGMTSAYQRRESEQKVSKIARFLTKSGGLLPSSLLISIRDKNVKYLPDSNNSDQGILEIPDNALLWVVDGQHRIAGFRKALEENLDIVTYSFPAIFLCPSLWSGQRLPEIKEGKQFIVINKTQTGVKKELVDEFYLQLDELIKVAPTSDYIFMGMPEDMKKEVRLRARALRIVRVLNKLDVWKSMIRMANERSKKTQLIGQLAMTDSVVNIAKSSTYENEVPGSIAIKLNNYWKAILKHYSNANANPKDYHIQKRLGIMVFNKIFPEIDKMAEKTNSSSYLKILKNKVNMLPEVWWHKTKEAGTMGTSYKAINEVADQIIESNSLAKESPARKI